MTDKTLDLTPKLQASAVGERKWQVRWETTKSGFQRYEVFTDPQGVEWVRARSQEATELEIKLKTRGLPPLMLKRRSRPFNSTAANPVVAPLSVDGMMAPVAPLTVGPQPTSEEE